MEYIISLVLGGVASWLQKDKTKQWPDWVRFLIAMGVCFLIAALINIYNVMQGGTFDVNELLAMFGTTFATSQGYYNLYLKGKL